MKRISFPRRGDVHVWKIFPFRKKSVTDEGQFLPQDTISPAIINGVYTPSRQIVALIAAEYLGRSMEDISLGVSGGGKPFIAGEDCLHFNLSHCGDDLAIAFASEPVGFDMEQSDRKGNFRGLARRFFSASEAIDFERLGDAWFLRLWTAKEAMLKLEGCGLQGGLANAEVVSPGIGRIGGKRVTLRRLDWSGYFAHVATYGEAGEVCQIDFKA